MIHIDQTMREVRLNKPVSRIVCLVPSITELLSNLGLDDRIAGITKFCIHPEHLFRDKTKVGGTKNVNHEKVKALQPDLIIANKEENTKKDIELLEKDFPVWISDISNYEEALSMIHEIGQLTDTSSKAEKLIENIRTSFQGIQQFNNISVLYLIWKNPYMAAGKNTFIDNMLSLCNLKNCIDAELYPEVDERLIKELNPELVFLSSEPFPFKEKHIQEIKQLLPESNVILVDGEYFSWYGSKMLTAPQYFNSLQNTVIPN